MRRCGDLRARTTYALALLLRKCKAAPKYFVYIAEVDVWIKRLTIENKRYYYIL